MFLKRKDDDNRIVSGVWKFYGSAGNYQSNTLLATIQK
jgi:hypothetical protein